MHMHKRTVAGLGVAGLVGTALLFGGAPAATADSCPAGQVWVTGAGSMSGYCMTPASGGGTGGNGVTDLGGSTTRVAPVAPQAPGVTNYTAGGPSGGYYAPPAPPAPRVPAQTPVQAPAQQYLPPQEQAAPGQQVRQDTPAQGYMPAGSNPAARAGVGSSAGAAAGVGQGTAPAGTAGTAPAAAATGTAATAAATEQAAAQQKVTAVRTAAAQAAKVFALKFAAQLAAQQLGS